MRSQILIPKTEDFRDNKSAPEMVAVGDGLDQQMIQDFEVLDDNFPWKAPVILYDQTKPRPIEAVNPFVVIGNNLFAVYTFVHTRTHINIIVLYAGNAKSSPMCKEPNPLKSV